MTTETDRIHIVLVPGSWLGAWAWDGVVGPLRAAGMKPHAVTLPGLEHADTNRAGITREDHVRAVRDVVEGLPPGIVLVGHSGGGALVHAVVDQVPDRVRRAIYVDSGPLADGAVLAPDLPADATEQPLPSWEDLDAAGSSLDGLDAEARAAFRARAVPQPAGVARGPVRLSDPRRFGVPVTEICTSLPSAVLRTMISPDSPLHTELDELDVTYVDLPTGHWPMFSRPADLAAEIVAAARA
ncbi:alpha/beta fold hydrolase [Pengzhenrongella sp.]|jgi:pimeloyl-ACP methyl ester carboxylesterase|uniref:alpha/beta fold hydrolase n=1 Tax=Pengzhenrongella sp. TaxID=2888820 RepID=UPI002F9426F4